MAKYRLMDQRNVITTYQNSGVQLDSRYLNDIPLDFSIDPEGRIFIALESEFHFRKLRYHLVKVQTHHPVMQPSNKQIGSYVISKIGPDWVVVICDHAEVEEVDLAAEQIKRMREVNDNLRNASYARHFYKNGKRYTNPF